ncbi:MAG: hypothetical protein A2V83_11775 [Nitrospirae bacterium RBG_16_64_22]|nr:MAG: hypothetical protein A2V83_11775 [Nitrospirae bacterium RBG_16_64_22]
MKRTTIFADEDVLSTLKQIAREREISLAEAIREALETYVVRQQKPGRVPSFLGAGRSGRSDVAERHESLLWARRPRQKGGN